MQLPPALNDLYESATSSVTPSSPRLDQRWSTRRAHIEARRGELAIHFQNDHGRPPTPVEALHLAQQATLETRDAKHEPRSLAEQRADLAQRGRSRVGQLGGRRVGGADDPYAAGRTATIVDSSWVTQTASRVLAVMEESRSTWQMWHVRAEAQRQPRTIDMPAEHAAALVDLLVDEVLDRRSVALAAPADNVAEPEALRRVDGSSVYTVAGAALYASQRILDAELRLLTPAGQCGGASVDPTAVDLALLEMAANGAALDAGQAALVRQMRSSGARLQLAIAPAGAGKTSAMRALTLPGPKDGGQVLGLAPSAAAAVLAEQTGIRTDTLAKLTWSLQHGELPEWAAAVGPSTLVIIDEAGMADTLSLDAAVQFAIGRGASVRLVGDDQQPQDRSHGSSCTRCSPADGPGITCICRWSATATRTPSSDQRPSRPAPRWSCSNRSWPATTRPLQPRRSSADLATRRPGCMMRSSATPMACRPPLSKSSDQQIVDTLDGRAEQVVADVTDAPAWPTLRANLIALAAETGEHPLIRLYEAALGRDLSTAEDMAAVLNWRLPEPTSTHGQPPLPWLPGIPQAINDHPDWRQYLARRSQWIADLCDHIRHPADDNGTQPHWVPQGSSLSATLIGEVAVWRAANGVDPHDRRPTGPRQLPTASAEWQQQLDRSLTHASDYPANMDFLRQGVGPPLKVAVTKTDTIGCAHPRSTRGWGRRPLASKGTSPCGHASESTPRCR